MTTPFCVPEQSPALPQGLDSVHHNPGKQPCCHSNLLRKQPSREATFQPPEVHKEPKLGPNHQSYLYCCLINTSPRPASTSTSATASGCSMPRCRGRSGVALLVSTKRTAHLHSQVTLPLKMCSQVTVDFHSQVDSPLKTCSRVTIDFHSQVSHLSGRACKCTVDFPSQVTSPLKTCSQVTVDFHSQVNHLSGRACKCTVDFPSQDTSPLKTCLQAHCDCHS